MNFKEKLSPSAQKKLSDLLFIFYAGGAALLSYSLVYALRKPFTAATFDGMELFEQRQHIERTRQTSEKN